jgi:hypothetical protein
MRIVSLIILAGMISGCAATYKQDTLAIPNAKLVKGKSVAIATPANGSYGNIQYPSSGRMTALSIRAAFARFTNSTTIVPDCRELICLQKTRSETYDYYAVPEILHWEDRATEWSGIPDKIAVKLSIYDGQSSKELASTIVSGKSKWATFGGDHPEDLLAEPLNKYIESLY